ncbi:hypothetical protein [Dysgonomonas sp. GY617]|uniref:hypothetical protein n=1 Tax=Dysgonomonas sp. GY617 TaxID=2780420 RepID=UPI0018841CCB|nr:hypothetical protein [Dysgonomonas sp. GY617]MBF0578087.1 hypothetical protein [Dysgonomonas sp. GY617]
MENPDMEWVMNKALFAIFFIQMIWYFTFLKIMEIIIKKSTLYLFENQWAYATILFAIISTFNYFTLIYKNRWFKYDEEFAAYSKTKNRIINIAIPVFYILSAALSFFLIDVCANLRHAGEIVDF